MANYEVNMTKIPWLEIGRAPVIFHISKKGGGKLGSLWVRKGHVVWKPADGRYGYWLDWDWLNKIAIENGERKSVRYKT